MRREETNRGYWDRYAKNYDRSMRFLGKPMPRMLQLVEESVQGAERVLEVGAGTGLVTAAIAREARFVVATDYSKAMVTLLEARTRHIDNLECRQSDIYALDFEPGSFDVVVAANLLHLVPDLPGAIEALLRVLTPGGRLVMPTFCHDETRLSWVASRLLAITGFPGHRRFTVQTLRSALEERGLEIVRGETLPGLIPIGYVECVSPSSAAT